MHPGLRRPLSLLASALLLIALGRAVLGCPPARAEPGAGPDADHGEGAIAGTLFWRGDDGLRHPALAIDTEVTLRVSGLVARARVRQRFENTSDLWLEGVYVFPLPERAAVDRLTLSVGDRRIEGVVQERTEAKRTYARARESGRTTSLVEQERPNLFTTSVANVAPREPVDVTLEYQTKTAYDAGVFELRFPMTLTPRYVPGLVAGERSPAGSPRAGAARSTARTGVAPATDGVPDAPRISPPMLADEPPGSHRLRLLVDLDAGFPIGELESPSHAVRAVARGPGRVEVRLDDVPADRDFVLRWRPEPGNEPRAAIFSEEHDGEQYALLMLLPPDADAPPRRLPREAIFVIDTSGSMGGASIEQARAALQLALDRLDLDDRFNVIAFDDSSRSLFTTPRPVDADGLRRAHAFVRDLSAGGGTEMLGALRQALQDDDDASFPDTAAGERVRQVVFITDASIGDEARIFDEIQRNLGRSRLFMVGIGSAPNAHLLRRAAALGRGTATRIGSIDEVGARMEALFAKLEHPVLGDLEVHWSDDVEAWPATVPDLYAGEPVVVTARLQRFVSDVTLTGRRGDRPFTLRLPLTPGTRESGIRQLWARDKIAHFMMQPASVMDAARVRREVVAVALTHGLVSKYTSLVAVDVTPTRPRHADAATTRIPNLLPAGVDPHLVGGVLPQGATPAPLWVGAGGVLMLLASALARAGGRAR